MTYRGRIKNGVVVLDEKVSLPEGAEVEVDLLPAAETTIPLGQRLLKFAGKAKGLPPDMAKNHDHYLYGISKK
jgi:hypothetical protein